MERGGSGSISRGVTNSSSGSVTETPDSTTTTAIDQDKCNASITDSASGGEDGSVVSSLGGAGSTRVPKKFITTWRHACDKTKDRTKDLFKRWRTLPETGGADSAGHLNDENIETCSTINRPTSSTTSTVNSTTNQGWSVHVWATWVKRYPSDEEDNVFENGIHDNGNKNITDHVKYLTSVQKEKLEHLFRHLFDYDHDDQISIQDFDAFCERIKHFADWSENSPEFITLQQVKDGFVQHFVLADKQDGGNFNEDLDDYGKSTTKRNPLMEVISLEEWLGHWGKLLHEARNVADFPVWLQYLPKLIYQAINTSGSGVISRDELSAFYSAILGLTMQNVNELLEEAYRAMTVNGEHPLTYSVYRLCFANFLLGRYPNGPGQYIFGHIGKHVDTFPIDYSAMNTPTDDLEQYTPDKKSNRHSVIV